MIKPKNGYLREEPRGGSIEGGSRAKVLAPGATGPS